MTDVNKLIMRLTGMDHFNDGQYGPPEAKVFRYRIGHNKVWPLAKGDTDLGYQLFSSNNDGFELWMGWSDQWDHHMRQEEVWALFKWLAIEWYLKARWLGLRRPIYYWALKRYCKQLRKDRQI